MREMDEKIQKFKQDRQNYKRILGQELIIYLPQPKALEDLVVLKGVIAKLRNLGNMLHGGLEELGELEFAIVKLKRDLGGMDLSKRYANQKRIENDQRERF